jgi:hypothetical protein
MKHNRRLGMGTLEAFLILVITVAPLLYVAHQLGNVAENIEAAELQAAATEDWEDLGTIVSATTQAGGWGQGSITITSTEGSFPVSGTYSVLKDQPLSRAPLDNFYAYKWEGQTEPVLGPK